MIIIIISCCLGLCFPTIVASIIASRFEQLKMEVRKGSMVNVNPTNTRPPNDTPEIRKYKKRFNSEILCAALWGEKKNPQLHSCLRRILTLTISTKAAHSERCLTLDAAS